MSRDWFAEAFGATVDDVRAKLIDEGWFSRRSPEPWSRGDLGWSRDDQPRSSTPDDPTMERGIDR
ncbi:hypothetical protein D0Z70_08250 [Sphingobium terrigena]|uniref:Uncharacterized protein n=1 Tax=Sphingobium terrigena TaxID=2304063 RepID=A0A418YTK4_9SPHN|nr:hypothetical protein [Sphingobium terrigena]RJG55391.1 hypothetical protein D0Z70_08250 [Sphingobium terrigena]